MHVNNLAIQWEGALITLSVSVGVATADAESGYSGERLFKAADAALYEAKSSGRNTVKTATPVNA